MLPLARQRTFLADLATGPEKPKYPVDGYREKIVAEITLEQIKRHVEEIKAIFADGFQFEDVIRVIGAAMEIAETYKHTVGMTGEERKALALKLIEQVIDETDTPWLPDTLTDPLLKRLAPSAIELVIKAVNGKLGVKPN